MMEWISVEDRLPPKDEYILVAWKSIHGEMLRAVSSRAEIPRHCFYNPPIDNRYWIFGAREEIKPLYWQHLPEPPTT